MISSKTCVILVLLKEQANAQTRWGERSTLLHVCNKILQALKYLGAIESVQVDVCLVLLMNLLVLEKKAYYEVPELERISLFFPFELNVSMEWLHHSPEFRLENFGGKTMLSATNNYDRRI